MAHTFYENHRMDPDFPFIFHQDTCVGKTTPSLLHWHDNPEIICFTQGVGITVCDTQHIQASAGEVVFIPSNTLHAFYGVTDKTHYRCLIVNKAYHQRLGLNFEGLRGRLSNPALYECFERLNEEMEHRRPHYRLAALSLINTLLVELARQPSDNIAMQSQETGRATIELTKSVISYMHEHLREPFSLTDMCGHLGYSPYYVGHVFKEVTGQSPVDYLNRLRCSHAFALLSNGSCVSEAAEASGFQNQSYFSRQYKRYRGRTPSSDAVIYAKQHQDS